MSKIARMAGIIFLSALVFTLGACINAPIEDGAKPPPPPGSLAPGYALRRTLERLKSFSDGATMPVDKEAGLPTQEVLVSEKGKNTLVEKRPAEEVFKSSTSSSTVSIKAGTYKVRYAVLEGKKSK